MQLGKCNSAIAGVKRKVEKGLRKVDKWLGKPLKLVQKRVVQLTERVPKAAGHQAPARAAMDGPDHTTTEPRPALRRSARLRQKQVRTQPTVCYAEADTWLSCQPYAGEESF